jgi:serine/threonine protein kinase
MDPRRWQKLEEIGARAAELAGEERDAYLAEACDGDDGLRADIEALLEQIGAEGSFLDRPLVTPGPEGRAGPAVPETIGDFRVLGVLGEGGMGTVYEAVREGDGFTQRVALKLIQSRFASEELLRRFLTERRILASLEHPGIARFIEGGTSVEGRPYVAMEYVEGSPILEHCRANGLGLEERLDLFEQVCEAVQHAHEKLVVHRDLKPGNILVTGSGQPKLLDFGIGKLLEVDDDLDATRTGQLLLTPRFAAPEQLRGEAVTTATDVYSLGILLYQLLTGVHPYATPGSSLAELQEAALTREVTRPSDRLDPPEPPEARP